jgi:hypothetical protein
MRREKLHKSANFEAAALLGLRAKILKLALRHIAPKRLAQRLLRQRRCAQFANIFTLRILNGTNNT